MVFDCALAVTPVVIVSIPSSVPSSKLLLVIFSATRVAFSIISCLWLVNIIVATNGKENASCHGHDGHGTFLKQSRLILITW